MVSLSGLAQSPSVSCSARNRTSARQATSVRDLAVLDLVFERELGDHRLRRVTDVPKREIELRLDVAEVDERSR